MMMLCGVFGYSYAQDAGTTSEGSGKAAGYAPVAGDFSGAILFGRGNFLNVTADEMTPVAGMSWTVPGTAPYLNTTETNDNSISNIVGAEVRYFLMDNIALKLSGGAILRNTPARTNAPGVIDANAPNSAWIPAYEAVKNDNRSDININLGGEYHFASKYSRLFPYAGLTIPFYYARRTMYDPTISFDVDGDDFQIVDVGHRHVETIGFGAQAVTGVDYYLLEGLYFGFELKPVSYVYAYSNKIPGPGLETLQADTHTFSFFSQVFMKIGFRF